MCESANDIPPVLTPILIPKLILRSHTFLHHFPETPMQTSYVRRKEKPLPCNTDSLPESKPLQP